VCPANQIPQGEIRDGFDPISKIMSEGAGVQLQPDERSAGVRGKWIRNSVYFGRSTLVPVEWGAACKVEQKSLDLFYRVKQSQ
jgi:hypothetical protein